MGLSSEKARSAVHFILTLIVSENYAALSDLTAEGPEHLEPDELKKSIKSYPGSIRMPTEAEITFDVTAVEGSEPQRYIVDAPVFTMEEGKSDLTVRMTVVDKPGQEFDVIFYDAWVM